jgi:hydrogenase small subunit
VQTFGPQTEDVPYPFVHGPKSSLRIASLLVWSVGAMQPSLEDILPGALPGIRHVHLHNPVLAFSNGEEFLAPFHRQAEKGRLPSFFLVVEGSIPNETKKEEGYSASLGTDAATRQQLNKEPAWRPR